MTTHSREEKEDFEGEDFEGEDVATSLPIMEEFQFSDT